MTDLYATSRDEFTKAVVDLFDAGYSPQYMAELLLDTGKVRVLDPDDRQLIAHMRNVWPHVLELLATVEAWHQPGSGYQRHLCRGCARTVQWPCGLHQAALAVLDSLGEQP